MKRNIIITAIALLISSFAIRAEEFTIEYPHYDTYLDHESKYVMEFKTMEDIEDAVELSYFHYDGSSVELLRIEIPAEVTYAGKDYTVVSIDTRFENTETLIIPHTVRFIKQTLAPGGYFSCIKEIIIEDAPIESLPNGLVNGCNTLIKFSFGNACKFETLPESCFIRCESLVEIKIPESVTTIEDGAFSGCSSLEKVEIPESVTTIEDGVFGGCESLASVTLSPNLEKIGWDAFGGCTSLKSIEIPESVIILEREAFAGCTALESVGIWSNVQFWSGDIGGYFKDCTGLKTVTIHSGDDSKYKLKIEYNTFQNCSSLKEVICDPEVIASIGRDAFLNCTALTEFTLASGTDVRENPFSGCTSLRAINVKEDKDNNYLFAKDGVLFTRTNGNALLIYPEGKEDEVYTVPDEIYRIGSGAFKGNKRIKKVDFGKDLSSIDGQAFKDCENLEEIELGSGLEGIGVEAFAGTGLRKVTGGENLRAIGAGAFRGAENLTEIALGSKLEDMGVKVFADCKSLKEAVLPTSYVPSGTFAGCEALEKVTLAEDCIYIGQSAFTDCAGLKEAPLPATVKVIGESAFMGCSSIERVEVPQGVKEIRANTFRDCEGLAEVKLPAGLTGIERAAFQDCGSLRAIELPATVATLEERSFKSCRALAAVVIPDAVKTLGQSAFDECAGLKSVDTGAGVTEIGMWAFTDCAALEKVKLGASLKLIGDQAFDGDVNIREIVCDAVEPPVYNTGFPAEVVENATVTVPEGSEDLYNSDSTWAEMVDGEDNVEEEKIAVTAIMLGANSWTMLVGENVWLEAEVYPMDATDKTLIWTSSNEDVATVEADGPDGKIHAVAVGAATITATAADGSGVTAECLINVVNKMQDGIESVFTDDDVRVDVYGLDGRCVAKNRTKEDVMALPAGVYILRSAASVSKIMVK